MPKARSDGTTQHFVMRSVAEAARETGVPEDTIRAWIDGGHLFAKRVGRTTLVNLLAVQSLSLRPPGERVPPDGDWSRDYRSNPSWVRVLGGANSSPGWRACRCSPGSVRASCGPSGGCCCAWAAWPSGSWSATACRPTADRTGGRAVSRDYRSRTSWPSCRPPLPSSLWLPRPPRRCPAHHPEQLGPADRAGALDRGPTVLHRDLLRVLDLSLLPALDAIGLDRRHPRFPPRPLNTGSTPKTTVAVGSTPGSTPAYPPSVGRELRSPCRSWRRPPGTSGGDWRIATPATGRVPPAATAVAVATVTPGGIPPAIAALGLLGRTATGATLGLGVPALGVEVLLARREGELLAAIAAGDRLVAHAAWNLRRRSIATPIERKAITPVPNGSSGTAQVRRRPRANRRARARGGTLERR